MKKYIVGNWKMNGDKKFIETFFENDFSSPNTVIICPPSAYLSTVHSHLKNNIFLGAQNSSDQDNGAYTGDISAQMLKDIGCSYVILGHSERRQLHNETDALINKKALKAMENGITPIICVGETLEQKEKGKTIDIIKNQLNICTRDLSAPYLIAYEPVWAIGSGLTPTLSEIETVTSFIKGRFKRPALYGGSVKLTNYKEILDSVDVDGVLLGGASLCPDTFKTIANG